MSQTHSQHNVNAFQVMRSCYVQYNCVDYLKEDGATVRGQTLGQNTDVILCNSAKQSVLSFPARLKNREREKDWVSERN